LAEYIDAKRSLSQPNTLAHDSHTSNVKMFKTVFAGALGIGKDKTRFACREVEGKRRDGACLHTPLVLFEPNPPSVAAPVLAAQWRRLTD
jgi:hypothetical protein